MTHLVAHLLTYRYAPAAGGLEASVERIAHLLAATGSVTPVVYVRSDDPVRGNARQWNGINVWSLAAGRLAYGAGNDADGIFLSTAIRSTALRLGRDASHVVVSFFATQEGMIGDEASTALRLPHVIAIRGTDYSYGMHEPFSFARLRRLLSRATWITTTNDEQTRTLRTYGLQSVTRIHNSLPDGARSIQRPAERRLGPIRLYADCGYSYKKATQVLLSAFAAIVEHGVDATLTITGSDENGNGTFWQDLRNRYAERYGSRLRLLGAVPVDVVYDYLRESDLYCSATLGEGCSLARSAALASGVPIVSTECGELADLAAAVPHVRLASPGDAPAFQSLLYTMCEEIVALGGITVDSGRVRGWREYFGPQRERDEWLACLRAVAQPAAFL